MSFATIAGSAPLRGVVAGAGKLGPYWARELVASPDTELAGWVDLNGARVRAEADAMGLAALPTGDSVAAMIERERPDFLVNVTAPAAHHPVTIGALDAGLAVLSEKPLAATLPEAVEMIAAADRTGRLLAVSQNRRYLPALIAFRETVAGLGPLSSVSCNSSAPIGSPPSSCSPSSSRCCSTWRSTCSTAPGRSPAPARSRSTASPTTRPGAGTPAPRPRTPCSR